MKKFISGFLVGAMLFGAIGVFAVSYVANPLDYKVIVNGEEFVSDPPALEVEGRTYLPLRAMGDALGVPVNWNEELRQAEVGMTASIDAPTTINGYATYQENKTLIDFGDFCGINPVKKENVNDYVRYYYEIKDIESGKYDDYATAAGEYLVAVRDQGYTLTRNGEDGINYTGMNWDSVNNGEIDSFVFYTEWDYINLTGYIVIAVF